MIDDNSYEKASRARARRPNRPLVLNGLPTRILTPEEEQELMKDGSEDARQTLVLHNMRAACAYAQTICSGSIDGENIFSACYDALVRVAENIKPGQQTFMGYAKAYIRGRIFRLWRTQTNQPGKVMVSLLSNDDALLDDSACDFDFDGIDRKEQMERIKALAAKHLSEQERLSVELHNFGDMSFQEIGTALGCSRSRAHQIHRRAIKKLHRHLTKIHALHS